MSVAREMTLDECLEGLYSHHLARRQLAALRAENAKLAAMLDSIADHLGVDGHAAIVPALEQLALRAGPAAVTASGTDWRKLAVVYWEECEARRAVNKAKDDMNEFQESLGVTSRRLTPTENADYERFDRAIEQAQQNETAAMAATDAARKEAGL